MGRSRMSTHDGSHPEYFDELCALAAIGDITELEFAELQDHAETCAHCKSALSDFSDLVHSKLPLVNPEVVEPSKVSSNLFSRDSSYKGRFLARARKQGIAMKPAPTAAAFALWLRPRLVVCMISILLAAVAGLRFALSQSDMRYSNLLAQLAAREQKNSLPAPNPPTLQSTGDATVSGVSELQTAAELRLKALEEQLQEATHELQSLRAQHDGDDASRAELERKLRDAEDAVTRAGDDLDVIRRSRGQIEEAAKRAGDELDAVRRSRVQDAGTIAAQRREIEDLSDKLHEKTDALAQATGLLEADRHIRELMGERNLRVADVVDIDSKGKERMSGRVLYNKGKSLSLIAYDLGDRIGGKRNVAFQVWGIGESAKTQTRSLGFLYMDNERKNVWTLTVSDPRLMSGIDSVFVTAEPPGGSAKPGVQKLLYALLEAD